MADPKQETKELSFEDALKRLEGIVGAMEAGELGLEEGIGKFEEGMALAKHCADRLNQVEKKVEMLVRKADRTLDWKPVEFPDGEDS
ncbi:MAG: exodeoxyribonuclease VII small subunit [Victivallales bacterium]|nr:exodeoxyribonuclease VII small subunit [Victivallales bacterium]MBT7166752.1 exodeoxyribonuclease VII small subunit [Victivallales bacterium]MBT7303999.1 exodeoxyribonuclease VII small subunit [Victivallales bacterium]